MMIMLLVRSENVLLNRRCYPEVHCYFQRECNECGALVSLSVCREVF